jgi:glutamyl/glutaminyl-tRNA synthetase
MYTLPHVLGSDGKKKLSKRDGAKDILDYRADGYLPEALVNFLATLGWNDGTEQEIFTIPELIQKFDISRVQKAGAHFDERRLQWINGHFIRNLPLNDLHERIKDFWPAEAEGADENFKKQVLSLVQERLKFFAELPDLTRFFFTDLPVNPELISQNKQLKKLESDELILLLEQAKHSLEESNFSAVDIQARLNALLEHTEQKPAVLFSLIRIATTQAAASPGLAESLAVLGKEKSLKRMEIQLAALAG